MGDLQDRETPAGAQHAVELCERRLEVRDVPDAEADRRGVERAVVEGQREQVALDPGDGLRLRPRAFEHARREVEAGDDAALPLCGDREVARAAARVEDAVAGLDDRLDREPPPGPVEAGGHHAVHHVVDRRDPVEHAADFVGS